MNGADAARPSACPGCGWAAPRPDGGNTDDQVATAACRDAYDRLLARSYEDSDYRQVHQIIVDAYACQHPAGKERTQVQELALCLMTLCLFYEQGADPQAGPALHKRMMARRPTFTWLAPPPDRGLLTAAAVLDARNATEHQALAREWGRQVWRAWQPHHETVESWNRQALGAPW